MRLRVSILDDSSSSIVIGRARNGKAALPLPSPRRHSGPNLYKTAIRNDAGKLRARFVSPQVFALFLESIFIDQAALNGTRPVTPAGAEPAVKFLPVTVVPRALESESSFEID